MCAWRHATHYKPVCFVFFFQFCDVATVVMHSQEELAKFGYRLKRKVESFKNHAIFLRARTYCLNISETIPSKSGNFGAKNPSYDLHRIYYLFFFV